MALEQERFYNLKDLMRIMGISESTARRWVESGKLPVYRPGGNWRFRESDLEAFIERSRSEARPPKARRPQLRGEERRAAWMGNAFEQLVARWEVEAEEGDLRQGQILAVVAMEAADAVDEAPARARTPGGRVAEQRERAELAQRLRRIARRAKGEGEEVPEQHGEVVASWNTEHRRIEK